MVAGSVSASSGDDVAFASGDEGLREEVMVLYTVVRDGSTMDGENPYLTEEFVKGIVSSRPVQRRGTWNPVTRTIKSKTMPARQSAT